MKLLLEKSGSRSRFVKDKLELDSEYELAMDITPIPYGLTSTDEQQLCDQLNNFRKTKKINWRINLKVNLKALDVPPNEGNPQDTKSEADQNYKVQMELTPYISSETGKDGISVLEMFRAQYPGTTFALDFNLVDSFADVSFTEVLNGREMEVGTNLSCQKETVISAGVAKSLWNAMSSGVFERALVMTVDVAIPVHPTDVTDNFFVNKRILHEELSSDTIIKAGNGVEFKCLKGFLIAHSDVLRAMFESDMKESRTGLLNMSDMSEKGVRALLKYIYYWDVADAQEDIDIAWELLCTAEKYNVMSLEGAMVKLLNNKGDDAFTPDLALKIFLFIRDKKYPEAKALKLKEIKFLKRNFKELEMLPAYKDLLKNDPDAVNDFIKNLPFVVSRKRIVVRSPPVYEPENGGKRKKFSLSDVYDALT